MTFGQLTRGAPRVAERCEVAVIGSGPGGAITACLLAEAGRDVLLLEEGPYLPADSCRPFSMEEMTLKYRNGGLTAALGPVKVQYVEGRCVGGGSEVNSGLYHRTPPEILDEWRREFAVDGLSARDLEPHFDACETDLSVGPWLGEAPLATRKLGEGAARLAWKCVDVPRWVTYESDPRTSRLKPRRQSMTETYVPRALRSGCRLSADTRVRRLRRDNGSGRWQVQAERTVNGRAPQQMTVDAETVFVCGGAIQTPALLRRSGIRDNVGNALRLHPMVKVVARFPETVNTLDMGVPSQQVKEFAPHFTFGASISSPPYLALGLRDHPECRVLADWPNLAVYYAATLSHGCGSIRTIPGCRDALVRYRITEEDRRQLSTALQKLARLLFEAGATALYPSLTGCEKLATPAEIMRLDEAVGPTQNLMTVHLFSSCPMGEDRRRCATDSFGRVHGHPNLYVSDASLLCSAPGVNPQGSVMAIARRNAFRFLGR